MNLDMSDTSIGTNINLNYQKRKNSSLFNNLEKQKIYPFIIDFFL